MKRTLLILAALTSSAVAFTQNIFFNDLTLNNPESYWNGSDGSGGFSSADGMYTVDFDNVYNTQFNYWESGFAISNQTADTLTGVDGLYSSYAGGSASLIGNGIYLIGQNNAVVDLAAPSNAELSHIYITNNNYAASSMKTGDQFAKKFGGPTGYDPDYFMLTVVGWNNGTALDSTEFYLADYRFTNNQDDYIVKDWEQVNLNWTGVDQISFHLSSTDSSGSFMNTPAFYALGGMVFNEPMAISEQEVTAKVFPNPTKDILNLQLEENVRDVTILNLQGKVLSTIVPSSKVINLSSLSTGFYFIKIETDSTTELIKVQKL